MGLFDRIKKIYRKVDKKVGGVLPGGVTPTQAKQVPTAPAQVPSQRVGPTIERATQPVAPSTAPSDRVYNPLTPALNVATQTRPTTSTSRRISTSRTSQIAPTEQPVTQAGPTIERAEQLEQERAFALQEPSTTIDTSGILNPALSAANEPLSPERNEELRRQSAITAAKELNPVALAGLVSPLGRIKAVGSVGRGLLSFIKPLPTATAPAVGASNTAASSILKSASGVKPAAPSTGNIVPNTVTAAKTQSWLQKMYGSVSKNPKKTAAALMGAIGSYPFAGFIKEEALQSVGFGFRTAEENEDLEGMENANELLSEILDPNAVKTILGGIPYVNVLSSLNDYFKTSYLTLGAQQNSVESMREKLATETAVVDGSATEEQISDYIEKYPFSDLANSRKEAVKAEERLTDAEYYDQIAEDKAQDKEDERLADAAYFAQLRARKLAEKAADRRADELYYAGLGDGGREEFQPQSSLNFGLLRTPSGFELADKNDPSLTGQFITSTDEISDLYFGLPFDQLTDEQRQLVELLSI